MNFLLTFEVLIYLNSYYFGLFTVCEISMNIAKYLSFELKHFTFDVVIFALVFLIETIRVILAQRANVSEKKNPVCATLFLTLFSLTGIIYIMFYQSEVLRFEYIICGIQLILQILEILSGIICLLPFCKTPEPIF